jgi:hypothetical protein
MLDFNTLKSAAEAGEGHGAACLVRGASGGRAF